MPIRFVGYLAAILLTLLLLTGALLVTTVSPMARTALQSGSLTAAWDQVQPGSRWTLELMVLVCAVFGVLVLILFSLFVGFSTHNVPGLGAAMPLLTPSRAATCWPGLLWTQTRIAVGLLVPAALLWRGYLLPGLIVAFIAVELAQRRLDDGFEWLSDPARHVPDLLARLGVSGATGTLLGTAWSFCFRAANVLAIVACAMPIVGIAVVAAASAAGRGDLVAWSSSGYAPIQLAIAAVVVPLVLATAGAVGLLVPVSLELVQRQKTRQTLVRVGRSRSWVARPGTLGSAAQDPGPARYDPYERDYEQPADQASLNSPSTTSSFPWEGPSEAAPPD